MTFDPVVVRHRVRRCALVETVEEPWADDALEILSESECLRLMGGEQLGRVAVSIDALPSVFPVNFSLHGRRVVFRTGKGTKLTAAVHHAVVAFEVDQINPADQTGWSVVAVGRAEDVSDNPAAIDGAEDLQVWAGGEREHWVAIDIELISGRRIVARPDLDR